MRTRFSMGLCAAVALSLALDARAESTPEPTGVMRTAIAGEHYGAGSVHRFLLGGDYRELWTTPIQVRELDFKTCAGGLTVVRRVGGQQTRGLALKGADGKSYTFRGLDKDPSEILPPEFQGTFVDRILQDQIASAMPGGAIAVPPILEAAGLLHVAPVLVVLPKDEPALGEFQEMFGGLLGTLEEYPTTPGDGTAGTFGATEIINGEEMWKRLDADPSTKPDSRAFLKARLCDILVGDWDRHRNQWRWAKFPDNEKWQPIPEDRDQAFVRFEGLIVHAGRMHLPQFVSFGDKYPNIDGLTWNGRDGDRRILVDIERPEWDEVAKELQAAITDDVIAQCIARLPAEYRAIEGASIEQSLRKRRDALPEIAAKFYEFLARDVDVRGTSEDELVTVAHKDKHTVEVSVALAPSLGGGEPYYRRTLHSNETDELRVYLGGGADSVITTGEAGDMIVRVIGGDGIDAIDDRAGTKLRVSDSDSVTHIAGGKGTHLDDRPYTMPVRPKAPWIPPRDWGRRTIWYPWIGGNSDLGLLFLFGFECEGYGFRKDPFADKHEFRLGYATNAGGFGADYRGEFMRENSRAYSGLYIRASGLDFLHFYGFGNDTQAPGDEDFYKVKQSLYRIEPSYTFPLSGPLMATVRASANYAKTKLEDNQFITEVKPYGAEDFLYYGAGFGLEIDTRDSEKAPMRGAHITLDATAFPEWGDVANNFAEVHGEAAYYQPIGRPTLALRVGGKKVWKEYPYHEAAYIGGSRNVRGFPQQRFAGDASAYGNAELRIPLARLYIFVPGHLGVFGMADVGRVYLQGETSDTWHSSVGGGLWCSFVNTDNTGSIAIADSEEGTKLYIYAGMSF